MNNPEILIGCVANLWSRMMHFKKAGDIEFGHTHQFDHLTLLASGSLQITVDGAVTEFKAPYMIYIHKDKNHELVALEDDTVAYCIHALFDKEVNNIIAPSMVPNSVCPPEAVAPLAPTKEELMAELAALTAKIQSPGA